MLIILLFVIGVVVGSFLNVLIDRLSTDRSFVKGRSYCEHCKKTLKSQDLVPLVSFLWLKGKCRYCHARIPTRLFLVELVCGIGAALLAIGVMGGTWGATEAVFLGIVLYSFFGIFVADIVYGIIPDLLVVIALIASLVFVFLTGESLASHLLSALGALAFFFLLFAITKGRGMGFGDVKLSFVLGLFLGFPGIVVALYLAFLTGAVISIILVLWQKVRFFGGTIPFGPFLIASTVVSYFYGEQILSYFVGRYF